MTISSPLCSRSRPARLTAERVWILDPVDGTREFSELDRDDDWAVHVALWVSGELAAGMAAAAVSEDVDVIGVSFSVSTYTPAVSSSGSPRHPSPSRLM